MVSDHFSVSWDNFHKNMSLGIHSLLENEDFVDVTLAVEGRYLTAHKMVLSVCSPYFRDLFKTSPCKHPIVFMKDVSYNVMSDLLQFMYQGEVQVSKENFNAFIKTAESLQIRGLSNYGTVLTTCPTESLHKEMELETVISQNLSETNILTKRLPLHESTTYSQHEIVKSEQAALEKDIVLVNQEQSICKTVSRKQEKSAVTDDKNPNYPLEEADVDENEDFRMRSLDKEFETETLKPEGGKVANGVASRSDSVCEYTYQKFLKWTEEKNIENYSEEVLLTYFYRLFTTVKMEDLTLWSQYAMLRSQLNARHGTDISKYPKLREFLKKHNRRYFPKKTRVFTREQLEKFLCEAPDEKYLAMKVVVIIAICGSCRCDEMAKMRINDIEDLGFLLLIKVVDSITNKLRSFTVTGEKALNIIRKYLFLRPAGMKDRRVFLKYRNGKCYRLIMGKNILGFVPREVASYLKLPYWKEYTEHCLRETSTTIFGDNQFL